MIRQASQAPIEDAPAHGVRKVLRMLIAALLCWFVIISAYIAWGHA